jgi:hypothetical protein
MLHLPRCGNTNIGIALRREKGFNERLAYTHLNHVDKGLVQRPEDWR